MLFWIVAGLLALAVAALVTRPLMLARQGAATGESDVAFYKAQLAEIERDLERAVLDADEAERARAEVARRLIAADARTAETAGSRPSPRLAMGILLALLVVSGVVYGTLGAPGEPDQPLAARHAMSDEMRATRPSQSALEAAAPPVDPVEAEDSYLENVAQLRHAMEVRPEDLRGWELLAFHESALRNYAASAAAQARVIELKGDAAELIDLQRHLDLMVLAADGFISPEAEALAGVILERDPNNIAARYYLGALFDQTDRADIAFRFWRPLVESGVDSYHTALARVQIGGAAARAGLEYTAPALRGPSAEDIRNAEDLSQEDRAAMIGGMVAGLADRLATQGGPAEDWARLITAYGVLGETEAAAAIWAEAQQAFVADPPGLSRIREAAIGAGVAE